MVTTKHYLKGDIIPQGEEEYRLLSSDPIENMTDEESYGYLENVRNGDPKKMFDFAIKVYKRQLLEIITDMPIRTLSEDQVQN